jgi:YaiO family outer membrane protein
MTCVRRLRPALVPLLVWLAGALSPLAAQSHDWSVNYGREQAATSTNGIDATWTTDHFETMWSRTGQGAWVFAVEHQERSGLSDVALLSQGYRRAGDWTFSADVGVTPRAHFLYRAKGGGEISYRAIGTFVASGGYHYLQFQSADVHQFEPALTWYHSRGEVQGRLYITRNATHARASTATLVRAGYDVKPRLRLGGGAAAGGRIFDIASLPSRPARGWVGFAETRVGLTHHDFITALVSAAREDSGFRYLSLTLGYRRVL